MGTPPCNICKVDHVVGSVSRRCHAALAPVWPRLRNAQPGPKLLIDILTEGSTGEQYTLAPLKRGRRGRPVVLVAFIEGQSSQGNEQESTMQTRP